MDKLKLYIFRDESYGLQVSAVKPKLVNDKEIKYFDVISLGPGFDSNILQVKDEFLPKIKLNEVYSIELDYSKLTKE